MSLSSVLQVNVRLSEGGAAQVARTLYEELPALGVDSAFAYGYGRHGLASPLEAEYGAVRMTTAPVAAANRIAYSLIGRETRLRSPRLWSNWRDAVAASDVVHLHAMHSHIVDTDVLIDAIIAEKKPVVWTMHDWWLLTGRCAQPGDCSRWLSGCGACPDLAAYPPSRIDHSARRWPERRNQLDRLRDAVPTTVVAVSKFLQEEFEAGGIEDVRVILNSVDPAFWQAVSTARPLSAGDESRTLFMSRDLRDTRKVDWPFLRAVARIPGQTLTIMGDHPPQSVDGAEWTGAVSDRAELARVMAKHERLVFTSQIDTSSLTMIEAITAGMEIFAVDSQAARELAGHPTVQVFPDTAELLSTLREVVGVTRIQEPAAAARTFAPARMTADYLSTYEKLAT